MDNADKELARFAANIALGAVGLRIRGGNENGSWDPVVPPDLHLAKLPPVAEDGTVACGLCRSRVLFANANIANQAYVCTPCTAARAREEARTSAYANAENVKLARPKTGLYILLGAMVGLVALVIVIVKFA
jgi:hypothetical protein